MQVWSFTLLKNETRLVTGSSDLELKVYSISTEESSSSGDGGGDEEVAKLGSKRKPEDSESRVSLHVTPLLNLLLLWSIPGLDPVTVYGQLCG